MGHNRIRMHFHHRLSVKISICGMQSEVCINLCEKKYSGVRCLVRVHLYSYYIVMSSIFDCLPIFLLLGAMAMLTTMQKRVQSQLMCRRYMGICSWMSTNHIHCTMLIHHTYTICRIILHWDGSID